MLRACDDDPRSALRHRLDARDERLSEYYVRTGTVGVGAAQPSYVLHRKLALIGERCVGKSSLAERFVSGRFVENYDPTIENTFRKHLGFRGNPFSVELVDTAGHDEYSKLSRNATVGVHGYLLVYSTASRSSLEKLRVINKVLMNTLGDPPTLPRVVVGTMLDAATGGDEQRTVTYQQGAAMAAELGVPFVEVSSRTGENVPEAFSLLLSEVEKELGSTDSNVADPSDTCGDWWPLCDSGCDGWGKDGGGCTVG
jgi:Ras family protein